MTIHEQPAASRPRRVTVTHGEHGWEVMEQHDNNVVRRASYTDWHRVERAVGRLGVPFEIETRRAEPS